MSMALGALMLSALRQLMPGQTEAQLQFSGLIVSAVSFHGMALIFIHQFLGLHGVGWREFLGLDRPGAGRLVVLALLAAVVIVPVALGLNRLCAEVLVVLGLNPVEQEPVKIIQVSAGWGPRTCSAVAAVVLAPLAEESMFRGILYPLLRQRAGRAAALWLTSLLFALIHFNVMTFVPLLGLSIVLTLLYERTDALLVPVLTHAGFNIINFSLLVLDTDAARWT